MDVTITLTGFAELAAGLRELPDKVSRTILSRSVSAGALVVQQEMTKNAQGMRDTGTLARSIYRKYIRELSSQETKVYYVGPRQGKQYQKMGKKKNISRDAYYARWVEYGHFSRPPGTHAINRRGVSGKWMKGDIVANRLPRTLDRTAQLERMVSAGTIKWIPPHPFMRPAFDVKKESAIDTMGQVLGAGIAAAARLGLHK